MSQSILERTTDRIRESWPRVVKAMGTLDPALKRAAERVTEQGHGRQPAICELTCQNCGDGLRFDQEQCSTCGERNLRYAA